MLVGHNVALDMRFFAEQGARTGVRLRQPVLATLLFSPVVDPDHRDLRLLRLLEERGITTLGQALEASRRTMAARVSESLYARR